jgi:hypothetical protein
VRGAAIDAAGIDAPGMMHVDAVIAQACVSQTSPIREASPFWATTG